MVYSKTQEIALQVVPSYYTDLRCRCVNETTQLPHGLLRPHLSIKDTLCLDEIKQLKLPHGLLHLELDMTQQVPEDWLPKGLEYLRFIGEFDHQIPTWLASSMTSLKTLWLPNPWNKTLTRGAMPQSVETLHLGHWYTRNIENGVLHEGLKCLTMGDSYNCPLIPGTLPSTLTRLQLSKQYNHPLGVNTLPHGLADLSIGCHYDFRNETVLPPQLKHLCRWCNGEIEDTICNC